MDLSNGAIVSVIVNFQTAHLIEHCIDALQQTERRFNHFIVIWENGTELSIGDKALGSEWRIGESHVWYTGGQGNLGYARGINAAYHQWRTRHAIEPVAINCCNPDTVSGPDALPRLVSSLKHHRWGAIAPLVTFDHGGSRPAAYPPLTPALVVAHFLRMGWMRRYGRRLQPAMSPRVISGAIDGAFIVFDGQAWEDIGGLDDYFGISTDDHDVCNRLRLAGWVVGVDPTVSVAHHGAAGRAETPLLSRLDEIQGSVRYVSKYYPRSLPLVRGALWFLLRIRNEPLGRELAWWARRAPTKVELVAPDMEDNIDRALQSFPDRAARTLRTRLAAERARRRPAARAPREPAG